MEATARARFLRVSSSKARRYLGLIKGKSFLEAVAILEFKSSPTATKMLKVLQSAGANAEENHNLNKDSLHVAKAVADDGPIIYRFRPRAHGRAYRIRKRTSHVAIVLSDEKQKRR